MTNKRTVNHGDYEARQRKACERLGTDKPQCAECDMNNPVALEAHHIAGQFYDPALVTLCLNHHAMISDAQKDHPQKIPDCSDPLEKLAHILLGLAELLKIAVEQLVRVASYLLERAKSSPNAEVAS